MTSIRSFEHLNALNAASRPHIPTCRPLEPLLPRLHRPPPLLRLTPVRPPPLDLLIPAQTRAQANVNSGRRAKPEALGDLDEIEFVHVEDGAQAVGGVGLQVGAVAVFGGLVEVVVFGDQGLELGLDVFSKSAFVT